LKPQIITTDAGEELVVLPRRAYDALLARLGDEEAEDRMAARLAARMRARVVSGAERLIEAGPDGRPSRPQDGLGEIVKSARQSRRLSQQKLAEALAITQGYLSDIERGRKTASAELRRRIARRLRLKF
jgi:ribosome-binding protein aMBF1 (putative translation factor)